MIRRSFRLRIALLSALLAGIALSGFSAIAWWQLRDAKMGVIDREIQDQAERELARRWPAEHWPHHEQNMVRAFGASSAENILLMVSAGDQPVYRSQHWPPDLDSERLTWPEPHSILANSDIPNEPPSLSEEQRTPNSSGFNNRFPPPREPPFRQNRLVVRVITIQARNKLWRMGLAASPFGENLAIGVDLSLVNADMRALQRAFLIAGPMALLFIAIGAWYLSGRALSPIQALSRTMENITAKGLDQRLSNDREDQEFGQLIHIFNQMLERLERSFLQASRFSADAAHELKTPLAILQGQLEQAISQSETGSEIQTQLIGILDEVQRLGSISRKLLLLSLADAGKLRLQLKRFDLTEALNELLEDAHMLAPDLTVDGSIASGLIIHADAELLRQVLFNLLSNAIKYNIPQGWIKIEAARDNNGIQVTFSNSSTGIADSDRYRLFERFFRADPAHGRQVEGVGLGLSLSREIARAHAGDLVLNPTASGHVQFMLLLPA